MAGLAKRDAGTGVPDSEYRYVLKGRGVSSDRLPRIAVDGTWLKAHE